MTGYVVNESRTFQKGTGMVIGLTGGVGSGKSTVLEFLKQEYGACVIEMDRVARELMEPGGASYQAVAEAFGPDILQANGEIDRSRLADVVYRDPEKRALLNSLTHPRVVAEAERRIAEASGLVVLEAALPREGAFSRLCDTVWYVHVPEEIRIGRLAAQRGYTRERSLSIMASQLSEEAFRAESDVVIENGGTPEETREQVRQLL